VAATSGLLPTSVVLEGSSCAFCSASDPRIRLPESARSSSCAVAISAEGRQKCPVCAVGSTRPLLMSVRVPGVLAFPSSWLTFDSGYRLGARTQARDPPGRQPRAQQAHVKFADAAVTTERPHRESPTVVDGRRAVTSARRILPGPNSASGPSRPSALRRQHELPARYLLVGAGSQSEIIVVGKEGWTCDSPATDTGAESSGARRDPDDRGRLRAA
jgi:hypothetical protein